MNEEKGMMQYDEWTAFVIADSDDYIRMGFMDAAQKERIPPIYYAKTKASDGKIVFNHNGVFRNSFAVVMDIEGKFGLIDKNGAVVIPLRYNSISNIILNDIIFFRKGNTCGFMNLNQTILVEYENCTSFCEVKKHVYAIEYNGGNEKTEVNLNLLTNDWRLHGQEKGDVGLTWYHRKWRTYSESWDHDHCEYCMACFSSAPEDIHEGYASEDNYHWICPTCYNDFKELLDWKTVEDME